MAPKRRAEDDGDPQDMWAPATKVSNTGQGSSSGLDRKTKFKQYITALNNQFADWVKNQQAEHTHELWNAGVRDYISHADKIVQDFKDVLDAAAAKPATANSQPGRSTGGFGLLPGSWGSDSSAGGSAGSGGALGSLGGGGSQPADKPSGGAAAFSTIIKAAVQTPEMSAGDAGKDADEKQGNASGPAAFGFPLPTSATTGSTAGGLFGAGGSNSTGSTQHPGSTGGFSFGATAGSNQAAGTTGGFSFGAAPAGGFSFGATPSSDTGSKAPATGFGFGSTQLAGGSNKADAGSAGEGDANKTTQATGGGGSGPFNFGGAAAAAPAELPKPSFGTSTGGFFNFAAASGTENGAGASAGGAEGEVEEETQKFESAVETSEEGGTVHFKAKAKLMHYKNQGWDGRGLGMLMLRTPKDQPTKPYISFITEAGRVLYCANVHKSMKVLENAAKKTASWSALWAPEKDGPAGLQMMMATLAKGKEAEFAAAIVKLQAQMP